MGLDTSHDCWHGSYSSFSRWREAVARAAGYAVWPVRFGEYTIRDCIMLDWGHLGGEVHLLGEWEETPDDPLVVLFVHHDHAGVIHPAQAEPLADALAGLLPLPDERDNRNAENFIAGLRLAVSLAEDVVFG